MPAGTPRGGADSLELTVSRYHPGMADIPERLREYWDRDAETYDRSAVHALSDPVEAAAWRAVLRRNLPEPGARVLDSGAGTGAITILLGELGYRVTALDLSEAMLARAQQKAAARGLEIDFVVGPADSPPAGPFDAVVERNSLWTNPDPAATLRAWREVTPDGGRLLALEGFPPTSLFSDLQEAASTALRRLLRIPHDHHAHYDQDLRERLPLAGRMSPARLTEAVEEAGWRAVRLERLRDVEWARRRLRPRLLHIVESIPLFALAGDSGKP
jgi:SAM-dependent methyltransferase